MGKLGRAVSTIAAISAVALCGLASTSSVQAGPAVIHVATQGADSTDCGSASSPCKTISNAVSKAVSGDDVVVAAGTYREAVRIDRKKVRLLGAGQANTIIDGGNSLGPLVEFIDAPAGTELRGFTLRNGKAATGGGLYVYRSSLAAGQFVVQNSAATGSGGGGVWIHASTFDIRDTTVISNGATSSQNSAGGGLYVLESSGTFTNLTVQGNRATKLGGGLILTNSPNISILSSTVTGNRAGGSTPSTSQGGDAGGGIYTYGGSTTIRNSTVESNFALRQGGGLYIGVNSIALLDNVTIRNNSAIGTMLGGGGIYAYQSSPTLLNCRVQNNTGSHAGGGVWIEDASLQLQNSTIDGNQVTGGFGGGGFYAFRSSVTVLDTVISGNRVTATDSGGGGGLNLQATDATLNRVTVSGNSSTFRGGGMLVGPDSSGNASNVSFVNGAIVSNSAANGGGVFLTDSTARIEASMVATNTATVSGGGMSAQSAQYSGRAAPLLTVLDSIVRGNQASGRATDAGGGGFFLSGANVRLTMARSRVMRNSAPTGYGGGLHARNEASMHVTNTFIGFNTAISGGGIYNISDTASTLHNDSIARNSAGQGDTGGGLHCQLGLHHSLANLIVYSNSPTDFYDNPVNGTCRAADVVNGLTADPHFVNESAEDFHITAQSPARNEGANVGVTNDIDGQPRDGSPDIGADEALVDLSIRKTGSKVGRQVTYTITFSNAGSLAASNVQIVDTVPGLLNNVNYTASGVPLTRISGPPAYRWSVQSLAPGAIGKITITGTYDGEQSFENEATIQTNDEYNTANNRSKVTLGLRSVFLPMVLR